MFKLYAFLVNFNNDKLWAYEKHTTQRHTKSPILRNRLGGIFCCHQGCIGVCNAHHGGLAALRDGRGDFGAGGDCATGTVIESWTYLYDGDGMRVSTAHFTGLNPTPDSFTRYYFGGAVETSGSDVKKYYSFAGQTVAMKDNGEFKYFLSDHLGSVSLVLDDNGTILEQQRYLPFGAPRTLTSFASVTSTDFTYTGQRDLRGTGLMDYNARFYSPYINHFIQPDTIIPDPANPQSWNRYSYVQNNPIRFSDPTGHREVEGCGVDGKDKCVASKEEIIENNKKKNYFRQRTQYLNCLRAESENCSIVSQIDRWLWQNIPSAIAIHKGFAYQAGFAGEFGNFIQADYVLNWRTLEIDRFITTGYEGYMGTPSLVQGSRYGGVSLIFGASSNHNLEGPSAYLSGTRGLNSEIGISVIGQKSISTNDDGIQITDHVSGRTIDTLSLDLSVGVSPIPGLQTGGSTGMSNSTRIRETDTLASIVWSILFAP